MKNDELDALTERAENHAQSFARLHLDGDGNFINATTGDHVDRFEVLQMLTQGEREAHGLYTALKDVPRRRVGKGDNGSSPE